MSHSDTRAACTSDSVATVSGEAHTFKCAPMSSLLLLLFNAAAHTCTARAARQATVRWRSLWMGRMLHLLDVPKQRRMHVEIALEGEGNH